MKRRTGDGPIDHKTTWALFYAFGDEERRRKAPLKLLVVVACCAAVVVLALSLFAPGFLGPLGGHVVAARVVSVIVLQVAAVLFFVGYFPPKRSPEPPDWLPKDDNE